MNKLWSRLGTSVFLSLDPGFIVFPRIEVCIVTRPRLQLLHLRGRHDAFTRALAQRPSHEDRLALVRPRPSSWCSRFRKLTRRSLVMEVITWSWYRRFDPDVDKWIWKPFTLGVKRCICITSRILNRPFNLCPVWDTPNVVEVCYRTRVSTHFILQIRQLPVWLVVIPWMLS